MASSNAPGLARTSGAGPAHQSLRRYRAKRDFTKTAEPSGEEEPSAVVVVEPRPRARFLVQKHAASRLHYDFRLEIDGVLKSWAVPKGPSLDPRDRRLAVEVEDHPLGYGGFEGTIPKGEYGGGTVMLWDHGTFTVPADEASGTGTGTALADWQAGRLTLVLHGEKLNGRFRLVRLPAKDGAGSNAKQNTWLLMKGKDEHVVDGGDVDHLPDTSVTSGRSLDEIAAATDSVWRSNREPGVSKKKPTTTAKKKATATATTATTATTSTSTPKTPHPRTAATEVVAGVRVSSADRRLFGDDSVVTKGLLAHYFEVMAPLILPHVEGRPLSVVRCPTGPGADGAGACFFQKHVGKGMPEGIGSLDVDGDGERWIRVDDAAGLVGLVQMGAIELHPWGARPGSPEQPDRIIMDVDPGLTAAGDELPWSRVVDCARQLRERLDERGLVSFVKSTGGKGLHVCVPLDGQASWDDVKAFCKALAEDMQRDAPDLYTANMRKQLRVGRVFVDYLRNGRGATAIAPYSPRARPDAPVSVPLSWDEIDTRPAWNVLTVHQRVRQQDPWASWFDVKQGLAGQLGGRRRG